MLAFINSWDDPRGMPNPYEAIPETKPNRQFPGGDADEASVNAAGLVFCEMTTGEREEQINKLCLATARDKMIFSHWRSLNNNDAAYADMNYLAKCWGTTHLLEDASYGRTLAKIGAFSTMLFIHKARLLPVSNLRSFEDTFFDMSTYGTSQIELFASHAWEGMRTAHPNAHDALAPWVGHIASTLGIEDNEDKLVLLDAAAALPYMMAVATRMQGYKGEGEQMDRNLATAFPTESRA
jgi:hypothetical protein